MLRLISPHILRDRQHAAKNVRGSNAIQCPRVLRPSTPVQVTEVMPPVQIPAPTAVEAPTTATAESASDAEALPLPGLPGATENENVPSPVEEDPKRTTDDPYEAVLEGITTDDPVPPETTSTAGVTSASQSHALPSAVDQEPIASSSTAATAVIAEIPIPELPVVSKPEAESGDKPPDSVSKQAQKVPPSKTVSPPGPFCFFGCLQKSPRKYPKMSKTHQNVQVCIFFFQIFRVFSGTFSQTPKKTLF